MKKRSKAYHLSGQRSKNTSIERIKKVMPTENKNELKISTENTAEMQNATADLSRDPSGEGFLPQISSAPSPFNTIQENSSSMLHLGIFKPSPNNKLRLGVSPERPN